MHDVNLVMWLYIISTPLPLYSTGTVASVYICRAFGGASSLLPFLARDYRTDCSNENGHLYDFSLFSLE